ncbi:MAG TPA: hypothetical protein PK747_09675 [Acidobacteriota bacterium]|nr:hypothetical protein [Acidobacteriota bacterium]HQQ47660.1 hypothetical protein [Acidobacteriota bacterium]
MKTRIILAVAVVLILAIALTSGASNMGFKLSQTLAANSVSKYVSLPYYNSYAVQSASYLRNDIIAAGGTSVNVYNWNGTTWQRWAGGGAGQVDFALQPGIGYQVKSLAAVSNWVIVGSHNPSTTISLAANSVSKYISVPYHTTATTASMFRNELVAAGGTSVNVYNWNGTTWQRWAGGGAGQVDFAITPGLALQAKSLAAIAAYTPAHY